jgi:hypothetical protein
MKPSEIYRNETERDETQWNVHKNWKGMQFSETKFRSVSFGFDKFCYVSFRFVPFRYISFRVSFRILQLPHVELVCSLLLHHLTRQEKGQKEKHPVDPEKIFKSWSRTTTDVKWYP